MHHFVSILIYYFLASLKFYNVKIAQMTLLVPTYIWFSITYTNKNPREVERLSYVVT